MEFSDRVLKCVDCREEFVFSAGEQHFFRDKGFINLPRHCKQCKGKLTDGRGRIETSVTCSECGASITVPFLPRLGPAGPVPVVFSTTSLVASMREQS